MEQRAEANRFDLPPSIASFFGRINDVDGHECVPNATWTDVFGSVYRDLQAAAAPVTAQHSAGAAAVAARAGAVANPEAVNGVDDADINAQNVWRLKMEFAPGGPDLLRREKVLDYTGVKRQMVFPGGAGIFAHALLSKADDPSVFSSIQGDRKAHAYKLIDAFNAWCVRMARETDRLRVAAILVGETPDDLYARFKTLVDAGVRQFMFSPDVPPGGVSPADPALDRVWALAQDAKTPLLAHIAISEQFLSTLKWREAPAFSGFMLGGEFSLDPWTLSSIHLPVQNFILTMVLGGVFMRHPGLRIGASEFTAHWVGPMADNMDRMYAATPFTADSGQHKLKLKPSEYLRQNFRISPFDFEPVGQYIEHFGLEEVYCYASDYPHVEGGTDPMNKFIASLSNQRPDYLQKFFIDNGALLLPD